jgi:hypothetical protein
MKTAFRVVLAAFVYVLGALITGMLTPALRLPTFKTIPGADAAEQFKMLVAAAPLLGLAMMPLARGIRGGWNKRLIAIGLLLYVTIGLNTMIEVKVFSTMLLGSPWAASLYSFLPCALMALILTKGSGAPETPHAIHRLSATGWAGRLLVAWLAFPAGYWLFGIIAAPTNIAYYAARPEIGFLIPPPLVILQTQMLRGALLLGATLPSVFLWNKSRGQFIIAMGSAQAVAIGIFPLLQATFMPCGLRVVHGLEITANALLFAAIVACLFIAPEATVKGRPSEKVTLAGCSRDIRH